MSLPEQIILSKSYPSQIHPAVANNQITFYWTAPTSTDPILSYTLSCLEDNTKDYTTSDGTLHSHTITDLTNGTPYTFSIYATNTNGSGQPTLYRTVQTGIKPSPPETATATRVTDTSVIVSWTPSASDGGATIGWYVVKSRSNNPADPIIKYSNYSFNTERLVLNLNPASTYTFSVQAVNDPGYSQKTITNTISPLLVWLFGPDYISDDWPDRSVYGRNATIETGSATKNTEGNALVLNGSTNWIFPTIGSHNKWTLSVWFKQTADSQGDACIVTEIFSGNFINMLIHAGSSGARFQGGFFNGGFKDGNLFSLPYYVWKNVVVTWDGENLVTYIDNSVNSTVNYENYVSLSVDNNAYRIGRRWDYEEYVTGEIGDVRIYQYALPPQDVSNLYNAPTGRATFPIIYIPLTVTLTALTASSTNLSSSWTMNLAQTVSVQYYSSTNSEGTEDVIAVGDPITTSLLSNTLNQQPESGLYYFVIITPEGDNYEIKTSSTSLMPEAI
jgi:hypothetical protein